MKLGLLVPYVIQNKKLGHAKIVLLKMIGKNSNVKRAGKNTFYIDATSA